MSHKRKKPSSNPQNPPRRPNRPVVLDTSTTDTSFLYIGREGAEPPSETARMVGEVASERDRTWFKENPGVDYLVRWSLPGEFPADDVELVSSTSGKPLSREDGRFVTVVIQMEPGARRRIPTLFMDGPRTATPIPEEVWGEFYEIATAEDMNAAGRALIQKHGVETA